MLSNPLLKISFKSKFTIILGYYRKRWIVVKMPNLFIIIRRTKKRRKEITIKYPYKKTRDAYDHYHHK